MAGTRTQGVVNMTVDHGAGQVVIPGLVGISGPDGSASEIEVTDLQSTAKEFLPGLADAGTLTVSFNYLNNNVVHDQIEDDYYDGTLRDYQVTITTTAGVTTYAYSQVGTFSYNSDMQPDGKIDGTFTIRTSGRPVRTFV